MQNTIFDSFSPSCLVFLYMHVLLEGEVWRGKKRQLPPEFLLPSETYEIRVHITDILQPQILHSRLL